MSNKATLIPGGITVETASKMGKKGAIASQAAKRKKKLMSAILADYLARQKRYDSFDKYIERVLKRGDGSTVSMIKTFVEAIEGNKLKLGGDEESPLTAVIQVVGISPKNEN